MSEISISERRLSAALDRIDQFLDRGGLGGGSSDGTDDAHLRAELDAAHARIADLSGRLQDATGHGPGAEDMAREVARLIAANDDLVAANAALIAALDGDGDGDGVAAASRALQAEIDALRAARAAEAAQLAELLAEVERLLSAPEAQNGTHHHVEEGGI